MMEIRSARAEDTLKLLIGQLALDGTPDSTIRFFRSVYPAFIEHGTLSQLEMAEHSGISPGAVQKHAKRLTRIGFLVRKSYIAWSLPVKLPITDPLLQMVARSLV